MSTLSIARQRTPDHDQVDASFAALTHAARHHGGSRVGFDDVFDLDYGQAALDAAEAAELLELAPVTIAAPRPIREAPRRRTAVRLTRRGRVTLTLLFLGAAMALMVPLSGLATASLSGGNPEPVRVIEVAPGDTLYGIAGDLAEPGHVRDMVHRIQELNSLPGGQLEEGQELAVPVG
jgi:hypothetical protein